MQSGLVPAFFLSHTNHSIEEQIMTMTIVSRGYGFNGHVGPSGFTMPDLDEDGVEETTAHPGRGKKMRNAPREHACPTYLDFVPDMDVEDERTEAVRADAERKDAINRRSQSGIYTGGHRGMVEISRKRLHEHREIRKMRRWKEELIEATLDDLYLAVRLDIMDEAPLTNNSYQEMTDDQREVVNAMLVRTAFYSSLDHQDYIMHHVDHITRELEDNLDWEDKQGHGPRGDSWPNPTYVRAHLAMIHANPERWDYRPLSPELRHLTLAERVEREYLLPYLEDQLLERLQQLSELMQASDIIACKRTRHDRARAWHGLILYKTPRVVPVSTQLERVYIAMRLAAKQLKAGKELREYQLNDLWNRFWYTHHAPTAFSEI